MARKRGYNGKTLMRGVRRYFRSISRTAPVQVDGVTLYSDLDAPVLAAQYIVPPTVSGLCLYLGIDRRTWARYQDPESYPELQEAVSYAQDKLQEYLERELLTREKNVRGIIFNLQANYGWAERREMELGRETRRAMAVESLSLDEKLQLIAETQALMEEDERAAEEP